MHGRTEKSYLLRKLRLQITWHYIISYFIKLEKKTRNVLSVMCSASSPKKGCTLYLSMLQRQTVTPSQGRLVMYWMAGCTTLLK